MAKGKRKQKDAGAPPPEPPPGAPPHAARAADVGKPPFCVVGLGASAGGLEALTDFFGAMKKNSGMAFVVVSHLDPEHKSALAEILAKTARMPVAEVRDRMSVEPNHVYVIPPNTEMRISDGQLSLVSRPGGRQPPMPIDAFLCSLAEERKSQAIGVILSGTGTDGTRGLKAIKADGGITFAQDQSARHEGMPRSAIAAGCVDMILSPSAIAAAVERIGSCPFPEDTEAQLATATTPVREADDFQAIVRLLGRATQVDFTHYKHSTLWRRLQRRMMLRKLSTLPAYLECLRTEGQEVQALFDEVLLQVSGFFRDPEVFDALKHLIFPSLLQERSPNTPVRIWVPGCATGEEVYSLAICLLEAQEERSVSAPIKLFATDISDKALTAARAAEYLDHAVADVAPTRLRRFFEKIEGGYRINKAVRDLCVFARQDVTRDPPFSQLDLISCRNLLIYLDLSLQARVLPIFHYALKLGAFLLLGSSETVGAFTDLFEPVNAKYKIYRRTKKPTRLAFDFTPGTPGRTAAAVAEEAEDDVASEQDVRREADRIVLARYAPCGVVIDEQLRIVQFRGHTGAYLEPAPGTPTLDLFQMARSGYLSDLRDTLERAQREQRPARQEGIRLKTADEVREFNLEVIPIALPASGLRFFVVLFEEPAQPLAPIAKPSRRPPARAGAESDKVLEITRLKDELAASRHYLQSIIEEKEAANEELKAANEEVVSSNEELQSTNEELETAKEEVQATNEELTTVNDELQSRIRVASQLGDDLTNLIDSLNIPTVVVGRDLRLRRFTPSSQRVLSLLPDDVGRNVGDFKLKINLPDLEPLIQEVLDSFAAKEVEVTDQQDVWYRMVVRPYKTSDNRIDGAVITLIDIDLMKRREDVLRTSEQWFRILVEDVKDHAMFSLDAQGRVAGWNLGAERLLGYAASEILGQNFARLFTPDDVAAHKPERELETATREGRFEDEAWRVHKDGTRFRAHVLVAPLRGEDGNLRGFTKMVHDITRRKELEQEVLETAGREQQRIAQDMHDSVGQELTALGLLSDSLVQLLSEQSHPDATLATKINGGIRRVLGKVRALTQGLVPVEVDARGLMAALTELAARTRDQVGVACVFTCVKPVLVENNATATHLFRIAQEAVTNALKHAHPKRVDIGLGFAGERIVLRVADDGTGMPRTESDAGGMGLRIMRYRAGLINADLTLDSAPDQGTTVSCTLIHGKTDERKQGEPEPPSGPRADR
jgi:two-component system CheB/CheR fusion protein